MVAVECDILCIPWCTACCEMCPRPAPDNVCFRGAPSHADPDAPAPLRRDAVSVAASSWSSLSPQCHDRRKTGFWPSGHDGRASSSVSVQTAATAASASAAPKPYPTMLLMLVTFSLDVVVPKAACRASASVLSLSRRTAQLSCCTPSLRVRRRDMRFRRSSRRSNFSK